MRDTMENNTEITKSKKILIISGLTILNLGLLMGAIAYFSNILFADLTVDTSTKGLDYYINYAKGTDIPSGTINPSSTYEGGNSVSVTLYKKDNTYDIYGNIYLDITTIGDNLKNSDALKYTVVDNNKNVISSGSLKGTTSSSSLLIAENITLTTTLATYSIYLWLDENNVNDYSVSGETIKASIRCTATMQK